MSTFQFLLFRKNNALYWKILILCLTHVPNILITFQIPLFFQNKTYIAHGHDMVSIRMIKLCGISLYKLLEIIFQNCLRLGKFPSEWKKANVAPTFKIGDKQCIKIIIQFLFSRFVVKCLKAYFITTCFHLFQKTT